MDLRNENLENLTSLWTIAGQKAGKYLQNGQFCMSLDCNADWPNRLWFQNEVGFGSLEKAIGLMGTHLSKITIPVWGANLSKFPIELEGLGFKHKFSQIGMSIRLDQNIDVTGQIHLEKVSNQLMAKLWSRLFAKSFGYLIGEDVIVKTMNEITYLIGFRGMDPVGTSVLYFHKPSIAGIHSMGIIPEMRRRGFAEEILKQQLKMAASSGAAYATLQASDMGKALYLKLGFQEQFIIKNFIKS